MLGGFHSDALLVLLEDQATDTPADLTAKAALRAKFIAYELPADFVQDLRADRAALDACTRRSKCPRSSPTSDDSKSILGALPVDSF